jgi:hypothetical protein
MKILVGKLSNISQINIYTLLSLFYEFESHTLIHTLPLETKLHYLGFSSESAGLKA